MENELRTRVIYDYGKWDFEQELADRLDGVRMPTDDEWRNIQDNIQQSLNIAGDEIIAHAVWAFIGKNYKDNN